MIRYLIPLDDNTFIGFVNNWKCQYDSIPNSGASVLAFVKRFYIVCVKFTFPNPSPRSDLLSL